MAIIVTHGIIQALFRSLNTAFANAYMAAPTKWEKIATKVPSNTKTNDYGWLAKFPRMVKWVGDKTIKKLAAYGYSITNDDYEATVEVERNDIEDENLGMYSNLAQGAGESAKQLPDDIVFDLVAKAFTAPCFDGQYFIDADHPVLNADGTTSMVSNKLEKALSIASLAKAQASFGRACTMMFDFEADGGIKLENEPTILLCGAELKDTAKLLMMTERFEDGKPNPYRNACEVVVSAKIKGPAWFILHTTGAIKPFIYQERKTPVLVNQTDMTAESVFMRKTFRFGAEARCAGGYGLWQSAVGSTGTDNS